MAMTRYGGHVTPSLTGMPLDISRGISSLLPPGGVAALQVTSKRTKQMSRVALERLCLLLPLEGEIVRYTSSISQSHRDKPIAFYNALDMSVTIRIITGHVSAYRVFLVNGWNVVTVTSDASGVRVPGTSVTYDKPIPNGVPNPITALAILRRRMGCRKTHLERYNVDNYGLDIARTYQREVLNRFLIPILGRDNIELLYGHRGWEGDLADIILPIADGESTEEQRQTYRNNLVVLTMLIRLWVRTSEESIELADEAIEIDAAIEHTDEMLLDRANTLLAVIRQADIEFEHYMEGLDENDKQALPDHHEIVKWMQDMRNNGKRFRIAFMISGSVNILEILGPLDMRFSAVVADTEWETLEMIDNIHDIHLGTILKTKQLPGDVDPRTMLNVMRSRIGRVEEDPRYGISKVSKYFDNEMERIEGGNITDEFGNVVDVLGKDEDYKDPFYDSRRGEHNRIVQELRLMAYWTGAGTYEQREKWLDVARPIGGLEVVDQVLKSNAQNVLDVLRAFRDELADVAYEEEEEE